MTWTINKHPTKSNICCGCPSHCKVSYAFNENWTLFRPVINSKIIYDYIDLSGNFHDTLRATSLGALYLGYRICTFCTTKKEKAHTR